MITIDQQLWNTLFGWMGTGQCMIPEGCTVPLTGVLVYLLLLVVVVAAVLKRGKLKDAMRDIQQEIFE